MCKVFKSKSGFTIVELLVVIVVIGILSVITIVSYNGITNSAKTATAKQAAKNVSDAVSAYYIEKGVYPKSLEELNNSSTIKLNGIEKYPAVAGSFRINSDLKNSNTIQYAVCGYSVLTLTTTDGAVYGPYNAGAGAYSDITGDDRNDDTTDGIYSVHPVLTGIKVIYFQYDNPQVNGVVTVGDVNTNCYPSPN